MWGADRTGNATEKQNIQWLFETFMFDCKYGKGSVFEFITKHVQTLLASNENVFQHNKQPVLEALILFGKWMEIRYSCIGSVWIRRGKCMKLC